MSHIPAPTLASLSAAHWKMLADYLQFTSKITEQHIARVIWQFYHDQAITRMNHASENMQQHLKFCDYKRYYQEKSRFGEAEKDLLEAEKYYQKYVEPQRSP